jgi:hypothetical protein
MRVCFAKLQLLRAAIAIQHGLHQWIVNGLQEAFKAWLDPYNFDANVRKNERLSGLTRLVRHNNDPALQTLFRLSFDQLAVVE